VTVIDFEEHGTIIGQQTIRSEMLSREMNGEKSVFKVPPKVDGRNRRLQQQWVCVWILRGRLASVVHSIQCTTGTFPTRFTFVEFRTVHHNLRKSKYIVLLLGI
jgi:hypothetical protein